MTGFFQEVESATSSAFHRSVSGWFRICTRPFTAPKARCRKSFKRSAAPPRHRGGESDQRMARVGAGGTVPESAESAAFADGINFRTVCHAAGTGSS